jgi:hypothetical protein
VDASVGSDEHLNKAYEENLKFVLPEVKNLMDSISGKLIVTSDHGEMLGDRHDYIPIKDYGHHPGIYNDPTTKIPWLVHESGERREVKKDQPVKREFNMREVDDQLRDLGYKI